MKNKLLVEEERKMTKLEEQLNVDIAKLWHQINKLTIQVEEKYHQLNKKEVYIYE